MSGKEKKPTTRLTIDIPMEYHRRLKALAAVCDCSIREIVVQSIQEKIFFDTSSGQDVWKAKEGNGEEVREISSKDLENLFSKLGI